MLMDAAYYKPAHVHDQVLVSARDYTIMEPAYDPDWGEWNDGALCPDNTFAHG